MLQKSFGQREPIYVRLRNILKDYPTSTSIKEILQNADDAKATLIKFVLDTENYGKESLMNSKMTVLQGPALLSFNNSVFKEDDYKSLQNLGDSQKKDNQESTGRFGIGFNRYILLIEN
jgi:sacsin